MATESCLSNDTISCATDVEFLKLLASVVTAFIAGGIALLVARYNFRTDQSKTANQELIKKRLEIYANIVPKLNDVYCFTQFRGGWRTITPDEVILRKRAADQAFHVYRPIFSAAVFEAYEQYRAACFKEFNGYGESAKIRVDLVEAQRNWQEHWQESWSALIAGEDPDTPDITESYNELLKALAREIGVRESVVAKRTQALFGGVAATVARLSASWRLIPPFDRLPGSERLRMELGPPGWRPKDTADNRDKRGQSL